MKIFRRRPSPAMAVTLAALVVALGGVAFATIPDSTGTFHGCVANGNGNLRVVESAADCRKSEQPISWNQRGPDGPRGVVTRMRGGPVTFDTDGTKGIPLTGNTWTQGAEEFQELNVRIEDQPCSDPARRPRVDILLDGEPLSLFVGGPGTGILEARGALYGSGSAQAHTLTVTVTERCSNLRSPSQWSVKGNVVGLG